MENYREVIEQLSGAYGITRGNFDNMLAELKNNPPRGVDMDVIEEVINEYLSQNHSSANNRLFGEFPKSLISQLTEMCLEEAFRK